MKVRKANIQDRNKLANRLISYWNQRGMHFSANWAKNYLEEGMASEFSEERFVCLDAKNNIIGSIALLLYSEHVGEIRDEIWNSDETGAMLLDALIKFAKKKKTRKIYSLAIKSKMRFYLEHGFKKEGYLRNHFKEGEGVVIVSKFL